MKKHWRIALILGIVALLVIAMGAVGQAGKKAAEAKQLEEMLKSSVTKVEKGDVSIKVVETGSLQAEKTVEVKSQVGGRVARLLVDEGDYVKEGDLIAVIDPQQTQLQLDQSQAQLDGAVSSVRRVDIEIAQRKVTAQTNLQRARLRVQQLELELKAQPELTSTAIKSAETGYQNALKSFDLLTKVTQPNARTQSEIGVQDANNNLRQAKVERDRQAGLFEKGYVSKRELEQAELSLQLAETKARQAKEALDRLENEQRLEREQQQQRVAQARADLDRTKAGAFVDQTKKQEYQTAIQNVRDAEVALRDVQVLQEQKRGSQASVAQIKSSLDDAKRLLGETEVRAPISGVITKRFVQIGELVNALSSFSAGSPIVKIEDRSSMLVKLQINEIDVARLTEGMGANITVDALPGGEFHGSVTKIAPAQIENASGVGGDPVVKYEVEVTLDEVGSKLKSGMSAKCEMISFEVKDTLILPIAYVGEDKEGSFVMLYDKTEKPVAKNPLEKPKFKGTRQSVEVGAKDQSNIVIKSGVKKDDQVVKPEFTGPARKGMMQFGPDDEEGESTETKE